VAGCFLVLFALADLFGLFVLELLFAVVELLFRLREPVEAVLFVLELLGELVAPLVRAVLLVLLFVDLGGFVEDRLNLFLDLFPGASGR
jgi:hypothetical protein